MRQRWVYGVRKEVNEIDGKQIEARIPFNDRVKVIEKDGQTQEMTLEDFENKFSTPTL